MKHLPAHAALVMQRACIDVTYKCIQELSASSLHSLHLYAGLICLDEAAGHWTVLTVRLMYQNPYSTDQVRGVLVLMMSRAQQHVIARSNMSSLYA